MRAERSALLLSGHPPGGGSGSSARGAVTLGVLRSLYGKVDALSFALPGEDRFADPDVILVERPGPSPPLALLGALRHGGSFYLPERRSHLERSARSLIESNRLDVAYDVVWAHSSLMARLGARTFAADARVLDIDNVAGAEMLRRADGLAPLSARGMYRRLNGVVVAREERRRCRDYDRVVVTSNEEGARLGHVGPPVNVVPNTLASDARPVSPATAPASMLFVGSLEYEPNLDALRFLLEDLLPRVRSALPAAGMTVAGRNPGPGVISLCREAGAELVADAPSLDPLYRSARVVVAPLRLGGGTRYKLIEAMSYGSAIVATHHATEGLALAEGENARVAAAEDFAAACVELLRDPEAAGRLGTAARETWERRYRPEAAGRAITAILDEIDSSAA